MSKQLKKFCRITKYIEKTDPKLYEFLDDMCVWNAFRPRRGHNGITFVFPSKETRAKIEKMVYTDDVEKAIDIVLAHVIHDYLPNAAAWNAKKSDIPNGLNKKIEVDSVKGSRVILKDGAELELDSHFKTFSNKETNQAVYTIVKGSLDHGKHTKSATFEHARQTVPGQQGKRPARGRDGADGADGGMPQFDLKALGGAIAGGAKSNAPFDYLVGIYKFADDEQRKALDIVYDYTILSTAAFIFYSPDKRIAELREKYAGEEKDNDANVYGVSDYIDIVQKIHAARGGSGVSGGATRDELREKMTQIIKVNKEAHKNKLSAAGYETSEENAYLWTSVNLARYIEYTKMKDIRDDVSETPDDQKAQVAHFELRELFIVLTDTATGSTLIQSSTSSLGILVSAIFGMIDEFAGSPYFLYPVGSNADEVKGRSKGNLEKYFHDTSLRATLRKMSADSLTKLFESLSS